MVLLCLLWGQLNEAFARARRRESFFSQRSQLTGPQELELALRPRHRSPWHGAEPAALVSAPASHETPAAVPATMTSRQIHPAEGHNNAIMLQPPIRLTERGLIGPVHTLHFPAVCDLCSRQHALHWRSPLSWVLQQWLASCETEDWTAARTECLACCVSACRYHHASGCISVSEWPLALSVPIAL